MNNKQVTTYFISGHRDITEKEFEENYGVILKNIINNNIVANIRFIVGDYYGVDIMAQNYLIDTLNFPPERITVYYMFTTPLDILPRLKFVGFLAKLT